MRFITLSLLAAVSANTVNAETITCPKTIAVTEQALAQDMPGWQVFTDKTNLQTDVMGVMVYSGPPEELASLVPDENAKTHAQWNLVNNGNEAYFLACRYANTSVQLTRRIPAEAQHCRVDYEANVTINGLPNPHKIVCH